MNFKRYHVSKNLFDKSKRTDNSRVVYTTGEIGALYGVFVSDFTPIEPNTTYTLNIVSSISGKTGHLFALYDENKNFVNTGAHEAISATTVYTFTTPSNVAYIRFNGNMASVDEIMLNLGSTALPYEPYSSEVWHDIPYYLHNTSTDTITTLPAVIHPTGTTATVGLKGNTLQSSIPSPTSPVMPQGTGERTGNLAPPLTEWVDGYINSSGTVSTAGSDTKEKTSDYIELLNEQVITFSYPNGFPHTTATNAWRVIAFYKSDKTFLTRIGGAGDTAALTASVPENAKYARLSIRNYDWTGNTMLNSGSTALSYEPYGIKIPISSASTTTPVYLGEVETTRKIKELILTGEEAYARDEPYQRFITSFPDAKIEGLRMTQVFCTHFISVHDGRPISEVPNNSIYSSDVSINRFFIKTTDYVSPADFKSYLQQQYANGTPVTIWYVLAEPTTGIVNEPLMKIGDYADSISGITIPTIAGANTIDIDTTLKPSEVTVNYHGWHPVANVHEAENGQWD